MTRSKLTKWVLAAMVAFVGLTFWQGLHELAGLAMTSAGLCSPFLLFLAALLVAPLLGVRETLKDRALGRWLGVAAALVMVAWLVNWAVLKLSPSWPELPWPAVLVAGATLLIATSKKLSFLGLEQSRLLRGAALIHMAAAVVLMEAVNGNRGLHFHDLGNRGTFYFEGLAPLFISVASMTAGLLVARGRTAGLFLMAVADLAMAGFVLWMWHFVRGAYQLQAAVLASSVATLLAFTVLLVPLWRQLRSRPAPTLGSEPGLLDLHLGNLALITLPPLAGIFGAGLLGNPVYGTEAAEIEVTQLTLLGVPLAIGAVVSRSWSALKELRGRSLQLHLATSGYWVVAVIGVLSLVATGHSRPLRAGLPTILLDALVPATLTAALLVIATHLLFSRRTLSRRAILWGAALTMLLSWGALRVPHYLSLALLQDKVVLSDREHIARSGSEPLSPRQQAARIMWRHHWGGDRATAAARALQVVSLAPTVHDRDSVLAHDLLSREAESRGMAWAAFWQYAQGHTMYVSIAYEERQEDRLHHLFWSAVLDSMASSIGCPSRR